MVLKSLWLNHRHLALAEAHEDEQGGDGGEGEDGGEGRGGAVAHAHDLLVDGDGDGGGFAAVEHDGGAELVDAGDPAENGAGEDAGQHQAGHHLEEGLHGGDAQADGGFLHRAFHLVEEGAARAHGVGQLPHHIGDDHDGRGAREDDGLAVESHDQAYAQDGAGDDVGEHHEQIHGAGDFAALAHQDIGDQHAEDHDEHDGDGGEIVGVGDVGGQAAEDLLIVVQGEAADKAGEVRPDERGDDHRQLGQKAEEGHQRHRQRHQKALPAVQLHHLGRAQGGHGVVLAGHIELLQQQDAEGAGHHDDGQGAGHVGVAADLAHVSIVHQHRQHPGFALAQQHRGAKVGQGGHEHHHGPGQNRGHHHRKGDREQPPEPGGAQVFARLLQGAVDAAQGP